MFCGNNFGISKIVVSGSARICSTEPAPKKLLNSDSLC